MNQAQLSKRDQRSKQLNVYKIDNTQYFVESSKGKISYHVTVNNGRKHCTCGDFASNIATKPDFMCKHIMAVINGNGNSMNIGKPKPVLDDHFVTYIRKKSFVLYAGLLHLAHDTGLKSIVVKALQFPNKDNGNEAICKATTLSRDGRVFVDYGDANPKNTSSMVSTHLLRVAATRAKARTLRDLTNVGMTCFEELGKDAEVEEKVPPKISIPKKEEQSSNNGKPSSGQLNAIKNLAYRKGLKDQDIDDLVKQELQTPSLSDLTADQAGRFIKILQKTQ